MGTGTNAGCGRRWVILDGDNTLWQTESLYDEARERFCRSLAADGHDSAAVRDALRRHDARWFPVFGYSANRFFRSLEDTYCEVAGFPDRPESIRRFQAIKAEVHGILHGQARLMPATELVLRSLHREGWHLVLMSAGDDWLQQKRIREFPLSGMFRVIEIVAERSVAALSALCGRAGIDPACSWLVGDSLCGDIVPAVAAGFGALWVPAPRWEPNMDEGQTLVPSAEPQALASLLARFGLARARRLRVVDTLADTLPVLGVRPIDLRLPPAPAPAVYAIFEGGGTKGIAHVGAYKACEERGLRVLGVAGTSAGAILAGFLAAGYRADELYAPGAAPETTPVPSPSPSPDSLSGPKPAPGGNGKTNDGHRRNGASGLAVVGEHRPYHDSYLDIMGRSHWQAARDLMREAETHVQALLAEHREGAIQRGLSIVDRVRHWLAIGRLLADHWPRLAEAGRALGYFETDTFVAWYNRHLARKVAPSHPDGLVRFRDIHFPLKIISTDLSRRALCVHPDDSGPDTVVAEAVAASMAVPLLFQPRRLRRADGSETLHLDGGILSNYPAWLFARGPGGVGQEEVPVLGFELEDARYAPTIHFSPLDFLREIITTAINGAKTLEVRDLDHLHRIALPVTTGAYAFDPSPADKDRGYQEGHDAAAAFFARTLQLVTQEQLAPQLQEIHWAMRRELGDDQLHLRVHVAARTPLGRLRIRFRYNMEFDPDDHLEFDDFTIGPHGHCWSGRTPVVVDLQQARRVPAEHGLRKYDLALLRPSLRSLLCVPVFDPRCPPEPRRRSGALLAVLGFDSDEDLLDQFHDPRVQARARVLAAALADRWVELATGGG